MIVADEESRHRTAFGSSRLSAPTDASYAPPEAHRGRFVVTLPGRPEMSDEHDRRLGDLTDEQWATIRSTIANYPYAKSFDVIAKTSAGGHIRPALHVWDDDASCLFDARIEPSGMYT